MSLARRPRLDDRRRLVIYSQKLAEESSEASGRGGRRNGADSEPRRKGAAYGSRVQQRLRARWYGIVPVRRRALMAVVGAIALVVGLLAWGHWAALWWEPIALRPAVARPLRLDRSDSFGAWLGAMLLAMTAGASFLVYQLRRYRSDDYHGHYRLWRLAILLSLVASVDVVTQMTEWLGATLDIALGDRDFLAGADWVRVLLVVGGAALGLRMTGEVLRNRAAAGWLLLTLSLYAVPVAVRWKLLIWEPATVALVVPVAMLAARASLFISVVVYLRMLYREVRKLEDSDRLRDRIKSWIPRRRVQAEPVAEEPKRRRRQTRVAEEEIVVTKETVKPRPAQQPTREKIAVAQPEPASSINDQSKDDPATEEGTKSGKRWFSFTGWKRKDKSSEATDNEATEEPTDKPTAAEQDTSNEEKKRGWRFSLPKRKRQSDQSVESTEETPAAAEEDKPKRSWKPSLPKFKRREEVAVDAADETTAASGNNAEQAEETGGKKGRFSLRMPSLPRLPSWKGRAKGAAEDAEQDGDEGKTAKPSTAPARGAVEGGGRPSSTMPSRPTTNPQPASRNTVADDDDDGDEGFEGDVEGVDWENLNKSERRRMRKILKRQGKAA